MIRKYLILSLVFVFGINTFLSAQLQVKKNNDKVNNSVMLADDAVLLGYNIYRNGLKINTEVLSELQYQDVVPDNGAYSYYVTAVYEEGESGSSNIIEVIIDQNAISREYVVFEEGTGTWCQYCPAGANGYEDLVEAGKEVVGIAYHSGDKYENVDANARLTYYGVTGFPTSIFDGVESVVGGGGASQSMFDYYLPVVEKREDIPTAFSMTASGAFEGTIYTASVRIEKVAFNNGADLRLVGVLVESDIAENWQGMTELNEVARDVMPSAGGESIDFSTENEVTVDLRFVIESSWKKDNCNLIAFVQDYETKEIHQATEIHVSDFVEATGYLKSASLETFFAPYDLSAEYSMMSPTVDLSWKAPSADPRWLHWDDGVNDKSIGNGTQALEFDVSARWDTNDLKPLDGMMITKVAYYLSEKTCEYSTRIWFGEGAEELVLDSLIEIFEAGKWNEIVLNDIFKIIVVR